MAQNDWTVVSETPATAASGWEVASEAVTSYKNLEPVGEPVDYSAAATAMEGTPSEAPPRKQYTGSIFDTVKLPEPEFDPREAERLSRREYAQRKPVRTQYLEPTPENQITRTAVGDAVDTTIGILQGMVSFPKSIADNIPGDNPLSKFFQSAIDAGERAKSPYLRNQAFNRADLLDRVRQNQGELAASRAAFNSMFSAAGADIVSQGFGSMLGTVGLSMAGLGAKSFIAINALANAGDAAQQAAAKLAEMPPEQWSNSAVYQELRANGMGHRDAVRMLAPVYALPSQLVGGIVGGAAGATGLERALVRGGGSRLGRAAAELAGEEAETLTPMVTANATRMLLDDKQKLFEGTGQAAVETAAGSVPGAALAAAARPGRKPEPPVPTAAQLMEEKGFGADQWEVVSQEPVTPPAPVAAPVAPAPVTTTTMREQQRAVEDLEAAIEGEPIGLEAPEAVQAEAQREEEPAAAVTAKSGTYTVSDAITADGPQEDSVQLVVRPDGTAFIKRGDDIIDVTNMARAGFSSERIIAQSVGDDTTGANVKLQEPAAVAEPPTEPMEIEPLPEQLAGERKPMAPEDQAALDEANKKLDELERDVRRLQNNKGRSLWTALKNRLSESELVDLGESDKLRFLKAGKNKKPTTISDLIHDRTLDDFLPYDMRPDSPTYDIQESEEYIKDKIRKQSYRTFDSDIALRNMMDASAQLDRLIRKELNLDEINAEIQAAIDEQREADRALEEPAPAGEVEAVGRGEEEGFLTAPTEAELRAQDERLRREAEEAARKEAAPPPEEFTLTGSKRAADEAAARGQMELGAPALKVGDMVRLTIPGVGGPIGRAGKIDRVLPNGDVEVRTQQGEIFTKKPDEVDVVSRGEEGPVLESIAPVTAGWTQERIDRLINAFGYTDGRTYGMAARINPNDFVDATTPGEEGAAQLRSEAEDLDIQRLSEETQTPFIEWDVKKNAIIGHEGRHRMEALARAGVQDAPVVLIVRDEYGSKKPDNYAPMFFKLLTGQRFAGGRGKDASVENLVPLSYQYRSQLEQEYGKGQILYAVSTARSEAGDTSTRSPSVKRKVRTLNNQRKAGKLTDEQFAEEVDAALEADEAEKYRKPIPERARGADFIRQKLLEAKRRGEISEEAVDFAEWFIRQNERLVDDLGIAIRTPKVPGTAGFYSPFQRIMALMKETAGDQTVVHEILHHLERMMPADVQQAIRKAWLRELAAGQKKATKDSDRLFFALMDNHHFGSGDIADVDFARAPMVIRRMMQNGELDKQTGRSMDAAIALLRNGAVPMEFYQYVNPSEFWAVNASDIMKGRFDAVRGGVLARLKNWLKELAEKTKDLFGMRSDAPLIRALDSLMKGDGKFVSKKMLIDGDTFLQIGKNIYSRTPLVNWTTPDETKLDDFIYKLQNKQVDLKRMTQEIEKSAGQLEDRWSPYLQEELYHGRTARATTNFLREEVRPLLQAMQKEGVSIGELEEYLHNRHAEERNDQIAQINDLMPDGGSGIMTQDARDYLAALSPEQKAKYERVAQMVDGITQGTRDYLIESGLEEEATVKQWEKTYGNYVPLNREDVEYSTSVGAGTGRGYSVRGPASRRATGSERAVVDILPNIIMQRERAIVRGEKNRVSTALYGLAIQNPNPEVWLAVNPEAKQSRKRTVQELIDMGLTAQDAEGLMQEPAQKVVDPNTGLVTQRVNPVLRGANNVLAARINGKDRYVFFNTVNPRAQRMALSLLNMDADQLGTALTMVARATRYMSNINTQYNPIFGPYNFLRDVQGAAIQLDGTPIEDKRTEVLSPVNVAGAMRGIYQALRAERKEQPVKDTDWSKLWLEFQKEGGQTGYRDMFSRSQERADSLKKELDRLNEGPVKKTALATPRWILDWLSDYNETLENAVRLSAYKAALDKGLSKEQAASVAKNLTVNFNRKGQIGVQAGAWYSFFNSAVQGAARMLGTIAKMERPGDLKSIRLQPIGKVVIYGGLTLGAAQALTLAAMGYDENEPPEFVKDRNVILPIGDGKYLAWPLPLGYHVIPAIGRILTEWAISGGKDTSKRVAHLTSLIFDAFNPIGNAGWSFQSVAPTIFDPVVALFENRDWTGKRIAKEDFNKLDPTPGYTRARENASRIGKEVSYYLNLMSGGDKDVKGVISPTPDQIDYLIGQAFGGLGREALKVAKTAEATVTGEELAPYNIPLAGRFYGNTKAGYAESSKFYRNIERLNTLENQIQGRQKRGESTADFVKENPEARLIAASNQIERNISALRKRKEKLIKDGAPRASVRAVENQITAQMKRLNEKMDELEKQKR